MKATPNLTVERYRIRGGPLASNRYDGNNGFFQLPGLSRPLAAQISDGLGWEHVSVSVIGHPSVTPTWAEMCYIKELFWPDEECVVQYHPPKTDYRNLHEGCLHLWRPTFLRIPRPDPGMVAPPSTTR